MGGAKPRRRAAKHQPYQPPVIHDGKRLCTPLAFLKPRRLAPGQSGELIVTVTFTSRGNAVVFPGSTMKLELDWFRGPLVYGTQTIEPAKISELKTKFKGQRVYDEVLIFRVPVRVKADAEYQKFPIKGHVEFTLHDAQSGKSLGVFATAISGTAHIGKPLPNTAIARQAKAGGDRGPGSAGAAKTTTTDTGTVNPGTAIPGAADAATGAAKTGPTLQASGRGTPDGPATAGNAYEELGGSSTDTYLWIAGTLIGLLIALFVWRRR